MFGELTLSGLAGGEYLPLPVEFGCCRYAVLKCCGLKDEFTLGDNGVLQKLRKLQKSRDYLRIIMIPTIIMIAPTSLSQLILSENKNRPPRKAINGNADVMGITREIIPYLRA